MREVSEAARGERYITTQPLNSEAEKAQYFHPQERLGILACAN